MKKKKNKRTPEQLQKLYKKQMELRKRCGLKRELEMKIKEEGKLKILMDVKNQLTDEDKKDMWFHLTHPHRWEIIKEEGLKGGVDGKWGDDKGFLYLVDSDCKKLWNGIGSYHLGEHLYNNPSTEEQRLESSKHFLDDKDYVVIGVPKKVFEILGCEIGEDKGFDITNYNQNHRKVYLGYKVIHPSLFTKVYEGRTDVNRYETKDRWEFLQKYYKRIGKDIPKRGLVLNDGVLGVIRYKDRKKITTKKYLTLSIEGRIQHTQNINLQRKINGGKKIGSPQQNKSSPFVLEERK